jgi:5-methyltetrahydropteroyltriglutamate--homocysteine methyltransferase
MMMEVFAANHSSYPKIGDAPDQQLHRIAHDRWERGDMSDEDFERIQRAVVREVVEEQSRAGLDVVTDGLIRWYDPVSHLARAMEGCEIDGLLRLFDTNFYFRQPVVKGRIRRSRPVLRDEFTYARSVTDRQVKAVMTGPYTLAKLSINRSGAGFEEVVRWFAEVLAEEAEDLSRAGAEFIQVEEPAIVRNPSDFEIFSEALKAIVKRAGVDRIVLTTYFGDVAPIYESLLDLGVGGLGLDFTYSGRLPELIAELGCEKDLWLGVVDGRNTKMEREEEVLAVMKKVLSKADSRRVFIMPSCGLGEYLPRRVAFRKLVLVSRVVGRWKGEQGQA